MPVPIILATTIAIAVVALNLALFIMIFPIVRGDPNMSRLAVQVAYFRHHVYGFG